jgi:hypothetical protein
LIDAGYRFAPTGTLDLGGMSSGVTERIREPADSTK